jgi:hypothetical protein
MSILSAESSNVLVSILVSLSPACFMFRLPYHPSASLVLTSKETTWDWGLECLPSTLEAWVLSPASLPSKKERDLDEQDTQSSWSRCQGGLPTIFRLGT